MVYKQRPNIITREIAGETLLVPIRGHLADMDCIFALNDSSRLIWGLLDGKTSNGQILDSLVSAYDVTRDEAGDDLLELLAELRESGLIEKVD